MKKLVLLLVLVIITSCIPTKVAPRFKNKDYKIMQAKKFKRKLPRETSFIFKDPKADGEFYTYIETLFGKNRTYGNEYKINIESVSYYFSYSEVEKEDETWNIIPFVIDKKLNSDALQNAYTSRKGHWYILLTVYDETLKNGLLEDHPKREIIIDYLKNLKSDYLNTSNYQDIIYSKKP